MFGGVNHGLFEGELQTIKTLDKPHGLTERMWGHGWQVQAHSLVFDDIVEDLSDHLAVFVTDEPWFQIPPPIWKSCGRSATPLKIGLDPTQCHVRNEGNYLILSSNWV